MALPAFTTGTATTQSDLRWMTTTKPICFALTSVTQVLQNAVITAIKTDTETINRYSMHVGSASQISIGLEPGWYRVGGHVGWGPTSSSQQMELLIALNGVAISYSHRYTPSAASSNYSSLYTEAMVKSTGPTDFVELYATENGFTTLDVRDAYFWVEFLGS